MTKYINVFDLKNNLKKFFDSMIPGDKFMPSFTKAVKIKVVQNKFFKNKFIIFLKDKKINLNKKSYFNNFEQIIGNDVIQVYFTSNLVIKALNARRNYYLKNIKKDNMLRLLKKVMYKKKFFKK